MPAKSLLTGAVLGLLWVAPAAAQYTRLATDTLRYQEQTVGSVVMQAPAGILTVRTTHDARLAVTFPEAERATAWYEALRLERQGPGAQRQQPTTETLLGRPFVLAFDGRGRVVTQSTPEIPTEIAGMTDLTQQFEDFFISLPAGELTVGTAWADTLTHDRAGRPEDTYRSHRIRSYRVERDTTVEEARAVVIRVRQNLEIQATSPLEGQGLTAATVLSGSEEGTAVFSPVLGRLLARERTGRLEGEFRVTGGPGPVAFPQVYEYESRLTLQR